MCGCVRGGARARRAVGALVELLLEFQQLCSNNNVRAGVRGPAARASSARSAALLTRMNIQLTGDYTHSCVRNYYRCTYVCGV